MVKSMTGYGGAKGTEGTYKLSVELKSVNNRYLDTSVRLPRSFMYAEEAVKSAVQTNPTSSSGSGSSSNGGRDNWDAFGERNIRGKLVVEVNGVLKGSGKDLYAVINNENNRRSL